MKITRLTEKQRAAIAHAAAQSGIVTLYRETSLSGKSETLRYRREWAEPGKWGMVPRTRTGMILSVKITTLPGGRDDSHLLEKYSTLCDEAQGYFDECRNR